MAGRWDTQPVVEVNAWLWEASSAIHGRGLFARKPIPAGLDLLEYRGEIISKEESAARCQAQNVYIFSLDSVHDLDGAVPWNPARLINHSCDPNCEAVLVGGRIWIRSRRWIVRGEELSFNYGYDLEDYRDHPCRCGAAACVGYMVAEELRGVVLAREGRKPAGA